MEKKKIFIDFEPNDLLLRITPLLDGKNGMWTEKIKIR